MIQDNGVFKDAILEIAGSDKSLAGLDFAFAAIVCDLLDPEFIEEHELEAEEVLVSLQSYKYAYGELVKEYDV